MTELPRDVLQCVGDTTLLPLRAIVPTNGARVLLKLESENPTGSMKDRMALAMVEAAEADGRLAAGGECGESAREKEERAGASEHIPAIHASSPPKRACTRE